jgi:hypothetical protein
MLNDGDSVAFYFDLLSFEDSPPKAVWVADFGDTRYTKRLSRKTRRQVAERLEKLRERLGPGIDSQHDLLDFKVT